MHRESNCNVRLTASASHLFRVCIQEVFRNSVQEDYGLAVGVRRAGEPRLEPCAVRSINRHIFQGRAEAGGGRRSS